MKTYEAADGYKIEIGPMGFDLDCPRHKARLTPPAGSKSKGSRSFDVSEPIALPPAMVSSLRGHGMNPADYFWAGYVIRNAARSLFEEVWAEQEATMNASADAAAARENAIEGLAELRAAEEDHARYRREFNAMMDDEYNDGVNPPAGPNGDAAALAARYPRAVAYLRAECFSLASHWAKSKAGHQAMEIILAGGSISDAQAKLENWMADNKVEVD